MKQYTVTGMSCAACVARVEKAVSAVPGVDTVAVSLLTNSMGVEGSAAPADIIRAVENAGYDAKEKGAQSNTSGGQSASLYQETEDSLKDTATPLLKKRLYTSVGFLLVLMYFSMGHSMWGWPVPAFFDGNCIGLGLLQLILTSIILVINKQFFISGMKSLLHGSPNMDTLVALGSAAAYGYSLVMLFAMTGDPENSMHYMHDLYFESAAMIVTLITVGKMLEAHSKGKTTDALKSLMKLAPQTAVLLRDGVEVTVPVTEVQTGDTFVVRPGESFPADGVILTGNSAVDESALTGESIPVDKEPGDTVTSATLNQSGYLTCRATKVGQDTTLSQIIQMVSDAAATKAPIAKIADKVSGVFVPVVIAIAVIVIAAWLLAGESIGFALARGISVLVISCPCALGLATPVAIMVGSGQGARNGILFKTAASLEAAGRVQIVALDKTGTITAGHPQVTDILPAEGHTEEELVCKALALESLSEHPLARAIVEYGTAHRMQSEAVSDFQAVPGNGLKGMLNGHSVNGGNAGYIAAQTQIPGAVQKRAEALAEEGKTPMFFAEDGALLGVIAVADVMKETSRQAVSELQKMGISVVMLTGDNKRTAAAIGRQVGVDAVISQVLPAGKEEKIRTLQKAGKVAMVGDGINDAPALTRADVGIAIGAGADVAVDAADVVLMKSDLLDVAAAIRLSRAVIRNIHENLFWAFFYNFICIPLAAGVWYTAFGLKLNPMMGAAAMSLSSFCVVTNALRLNWKKLYDSKRDHAMKHRVELSPELPGETETNKQEESTMTKTIKIEGMMCPHCEAAMTKALNGMEGVTVVSVSHEAKNAVVTCEREVAEGEFKAVVEEAGYKFCGLE